MNLTLPEEGQTSDQVVLGVHLVEYSRFKRRIIMEEVKNSVSGEEKPVVDTTQDYISAINEIKQNTVSKEAYNKVVEDNKKLLDSLVHGTGNGQDQEQKPKEPDIDELREELYGVNRNDMTNYEYVDKTLQLRKAIMDKGGGDPFVPSGMKIQPSLEEFQKAQNVADILQEQVDDVKNNYGGDPSIFNDKLSRIING